MLICWRSYYFQGSSNSWNNITMTVLAILGGVGVAYGFVNVKEASIDKKE